VLWGAALTLLFTVGLVCWLVIVPVRQAGQVLREYRSDVDAWSRRKPPGPPPDVEVYFARLGNAGEATRALSLYLRMPQRWAPHRSEAVLLLGYCGTRGEALLMATLRADEDAWVRAQAASSLGRIRSTRSLPSLIAALGDDAGEVRDSAAWALGHIGDWRATEPLIGLLRDPDGDVRWMVVMALGELRDPRAVGPLIASLQNETHSGARDYAAEALGKIGSPLAVKALEAALKHKESSLRYHASEALKKIRSKEKSADGARSGNLGSLRAALAEVKSPEVLLDNFRILKSTHADYAESACGSVGGEPAPVMYFFFCGSGRIYRIHEDKRVVEIPRPPKWLEESRSAVRKGPRKLEEKKQ
jgi:hypothetical protein